MSIMVIVTSVLLVRQSKFDSSTLLRSLAYSVALSVRQAQVYGTSVFGTTTSSGLQYASGYGIYVDITNTTSYTLFADLNNNGTYDLGEDVKVFSLGQGYSISQICATTGAPTTQYCSNGGGVTSLSTVYRRPNPEACITTNLSLIACATPPSGTSYATSSIQIQRTGADTGSTRSIYINTTGQISVGSAGT